ncbi:Outer membrane protein OmpA [Granulicella rosea]|uniref:Outer membrane protein OmpA n=2 Tax=Granulicella rosea TaxID=474952 RepID=A0A239IZM3_9BACT|nr:OmpA family protein [Granulicella rosea]SNS98658.1 Outer membrane protein OmpA [Granulicella rosea]
MVYRPFHSIGRFLLAACAVSLGAASLNAQTAAPMGPNPSRVDIFAGYSYFGAHGVVKPSGVAYSSVNEGEILSGAYYFNKYAGFEIDGAAHPDGKNDALFTGVAGPVFRAPMQGFTLFAHGLVGGGRIGGPNSEGPVIYHEAYTWGPVIKAGGGMDYDLPFFHNRFSLRLFQADYQWIHADFGPYETDAIGQSVGGRTNMSGVVLSTGLVAHFGHIIPPPPVTYTCAVAPTTVFPGDPVTVTGTAVNLNPKKTATYTWSSTGGTVSGSSSVANVDTKDLAPGSYTVKGHVSEGAKIGQFADCSGDFTVKAFEPPTIGCSANPSTVNPGDSSTITATGVSPQNRPLTYSYSATAGTVSGSTNTATLSTAGAAPGTITVTCNVVDDKGQTATQMTTVTVVAPPKPPAPTTSSLCSVSFERDKKRPARVDNEGKACLDDLALNLQRTTDSKLAVVGNGATSEKKAAAKLAAERAVNTKDYLVTEKGIDASRIQVYTGSQDAKTVTTTLVPAGATLDSTGTTPVDEAAVKPQPRKAMAAKKHHHKK